MALPPESPSRLLERGDPVPWFRAQALDGLPDYVFDSAAGRVIVLLFIGSAGDARCAGALQQALARRSLFDDDNCCFFGITVDPADQAENRIRKALPGIRHFLDYDRSVSALFGATAGETGYRPHWLVIDRTLRAIGRFAIEDGEAALEAAADAARQPAQPDWAPVLMAPNVIEPDLCRTLIDYYSSHGGEPSGFMSEIGGTTKAVSDPNHKVRQDCVIDDRDLRSLLLSRIRRHLLPMVHRVFQFEVTRMERYIVGCYDAGTGGHFRPHRDNTTKGTAHRRFAVTINLNADEYEGGDLRFPEYGPHTYRPPTGGAVVFSCSLLHEATRVTTGRRFAFLPFLYDEAAAVLRERNNAFLADNVGPYRRSGPAG